MHGVVKNGPLRSNAGSQGGVMVAALRPHLRRLEHPIELPRADGLLGSDRVRTAPETD